MDNQLRIKHENATSCIMTWLIAIDFEGSAFNTLCSGFKGSCFESLNDTIQANL